MIPTHAAQSPFHPNFLYFSLPTPAAIPSARVIPLGHKTNVKLNRVEDWKKNGLLFDMKEI